MTDQAVDGGGRAGQARSTRTTAPPSGAAPFLGRARELASLREDIGRTGLDTLSGRRPARARVLLVAGRPGSGRTRLAEELARRLAADYPGGVLRARLTDPDGRPVSTERTARDLLAALGGAAVPGAGEDELTEAVRDALAGTGTVLLLDDAGDPEEVDPLIPDAPDCLVLATSEGPLTGVPDVRPCTLGGLDAGAAVDLLARHAGSTRITVDPCAAESLAEECAGQPAALVLVGGWLAARPEVSVADAVQRLRAVPPVDGAAGGGRQVARALRLVHDSLPPPAARMLRLLALAPAGFVDVHIASALAGCSPSAARSALGAFAANGLLQPADDTGAWPAARAGRGGAARDGAPGFPGRHIPGKGGPGEGDTGKEDVAAGDRSGGTAGPAAGAPPGPWPEDSLAESAERLADRTAGLYRIPGCLAPLLRALLLDRDKPAEVLLARARMLERTVRRLQLCRAAAEPAGTPARKRPAGEPRDLGFPSARAAADWLGTRLAMLRAAAVLAVEDGQLDTQARRLVAALGRALITHRGEEGAAPELYPLHRLVLEVAERRDLDADRAAALLNLADLDASAGRFPEALGRYRGALEAARSAGDQRLAARALESLGGTYEELADWQRAADWYVRALALRLSRGEVAEEARLHERLGEVHTRAGHWAEALRSWRAAVAARRRMQDPAGHAQALAGTAGVQECAGRPLEALDTFEEALGRAQHAGDRRLQAAVRLRMSGALERLGDPASARLQREAAERLLGSSERSAYEIRSAPVED